MSSTPSSPSEPRGATSWFVPPWLTGAVDLPTFLVLDTRSAQGRLEQRPKSVSVADLILFHGHACDGLLRGAYALRALFNLAFGDLPIDRTDILVVSKNSPCLGDVAAYLTGARARFGTHRLDDDLGVGFQIQMISTGQAWEVHEEPGFFPPLIADWERALSRGDLPEADLPELIAINEEAQWNWVRHELLPTRPAEHYHARQLDSLTPPPAIHRATRTDIINRSRPAPALFAGVYPDGPAVRAIGRSSEHTDERLRAAYRQGPPGTR